ncbi:Transporter [Frankia canadensis]|uniref:Transporter n=1 Tax=Frankia canadensis TaxID=1836972 RepID=A0A2I2KR80_9ACTN|nr:cation:proton antiporter [Frankia canadensis]SNQ48159.1 Transporter [Frankia canadensis]SOU55449.1 Transporter [Frankia canadensis]
MELGRSLVALGGSFLAAGLLARAGRRIGLPTIPVFMAAGILLGPHTPGLVLFEDPGELKVLAALGLIFLLFSLGLEFHLDQLIGGGRRLLFAGGSYLLLNVGGGLLFGHLLGWGEREAVALAGIVGISSSAIVTKLLFELRRMNRGETPLILGIIVVEDVFLAFYLALLQPIIKGSSGMTDLALQVGRGFAFLLALAALARWGARTVARLVDDPDDDLLVVCFVGLAVLVAGGAELVGVSDAIGAFMAGLILAASPVAGRVRPLVVPLRDAFGALFFFAFGLRIAPADVWSVAGPVLAAIVLTLVLNAAAGLVAARIHRMDMTAAVTITLSVLARGEFALIVASLAAAAGLDARIAPFTAGYVLILAVIGPLAASHSDAIARLLPGGSRPVPGAAADPAGARPAAPAGEDRPGDLRPRASEPDPLPVPSRPDHADARAHGLAHETGRDRPLDVHPKCDQSQVEQELPRTASGDRAAR